MSPFFVKPLIVDKEPLIDDTNPPIAKSFALIVDRKPPIDDREPLIASATIKNNYKKTTKKNHFQ